MSWRLVHKDFADSLEDKMAFTKAPMNVLASLFPTARGSNLELRPLVRNDSSENFQSFLAVSPAHLPAGSDNSQELAQMYWAPMWPKEEDWFKH